MKEILVSFYLYATIILFLYSSAEIDCIQNNSQFKYEVKYLDTHLDHFNFRAYNVTFKLRYVISKLYWHPGNAILFYCGNEDSILSTIRRAGFLWELGERFSAMIVLGEHRYYGDSLPFGNISFSSSEYFGYLTSMQVLADYVSLITHLKESIPGAERSAVIAIGGSYGGMLAVWLRLKYPNVVAGSLASSAPITMLNDVANCGQANRILTESFRRHGGDQCVNNIRRVWPIIQHMNHTPEGLGVLSSIFRTCDPLTDAKSLIIKIMDAIFTIGTANYPYPFTYVSPMPAWPIKEFCKDLTKAIATPRTLLEAVFTGVSVFYNYTRKNRCLSVGETTNPDDIAWELQTCMEFQFPICSNGVTDMFFKQDYDEEKREKYCTKKYKIKPRWRWSSMQYGGGRLEGASNLILSNGEMDPWAAGTLMQSTIDSVHIITMPSAAHHIDLSSSHPKDPSDVTRARARETVIIQSWIKEWSRKH